MPIQGNQGNPDCFFWQCFKYLLYSCIFFQLFHKLQLTKQEIQDLQEEHVRERQELEQTQNELTRELKLKYVHCTSTF